MKKIYLLISFYLIYNVSQSQIISYAINQTLAGPGQLSLDINNDASNDYTFDILTLSPGVYAARVLPIGISKILDNSTFGYPDTLNLNDSVVGYFHSNTGVLGTFTNAGQFKGAGNKYLGIKINVGGSNYLGWIKLNCNLNRDTLKIISCGYNTVDSAPILAGQTTLVGITGFVGNMPDVKLFPNPAQRIVNIESGTQNEMFEIRVLNVLGETVYNQSSLIDHSLQIDVTSFSTGNYFVNLRSSKASVTKKISIQK